MKAKLQIAIDSIAHQVLDDLQINYKKGKTQIDLTLKGEDLERFESLLLLRMKQFNERMQTNSGSK